MSATQDVSLGLHILELEITSRCNLGCGYCYNRGKPVQDLPFDTITELVCFAEEHKVWRLVCSGGEACLHPEFDRLLDFFREAKPKTELVLQSNGKIGEYDLNRLTAFRVVHLSLEPEDTGVRDISIGNTIAIAKRLQTLGVYTYLFVTVHSKNFNRIDELVSLASRERMAIGFNLCFSVNCAFGLALTVECQAEIIRKLYQLSNEKKILHFSSPYAAILREKRSDGYIGNRGGCTAGIAACVVLPNGDIAPCPFLRLKAGNIFNQSLKEVWLCSKVFTAMRDRSKFAQPCGNCEYVSYCGGCRAKAFANSGKLTGLDPGCPRILIDQ